MIEYWAKLADDYNGRNPWDTSWSVDLLPEKYYKKFERFCRTILREAYRNRGYLNVDGLDFDEVRRKLLIAKRFPGEMVKQFMLREQVNLIVDDAIDGGLKSVFIIKKGEKVRINERQKEALCKQGLERKRKEFPDGTFSSYEGLLEFLLIGGKKVVEAKEEKKDDGIEKVVPTKLEDGKWKCGYCDRVSRVKAAILSHMKTHER
jgi:hypothetical protein